MESKSVNDEVAVFVSSVERLKYSGSTWMKLLGHVPVVGIMVRSAMDMANLRSRYRVERTLAEAGVSNGKLAAAVLTGLIGAVALGFLGSLFNPFEVTGTGSVILFTLVLVILAFVFVPMIATGVAVVVGTAGHSAGKGRNGIILNSNLAPMAKRNIFSPKD